jgi:hypothetical protein
MAREGRRNVLPAMAAISVGLRQAMEEPGPQAPRPQAPAVLVADAAADRSRDSFGKTTRFSGEKS